MARHLPTPAADYSPSAAMRRCSSFSESSLSLPSCFSARIARSLSFSTLLSARFFAASSSAILGAQRDVPELLGGELPARGREAELVAGGVLEDVRDRHGVLLPVSAHAPT
jgi:hypothetical protein